MFRLTEGDRGRAPRNRHPLVRSRPVISLQSMGSPSEMLFVAAAIIGLVSSRIFLFSTGEGGVNALGIAQVPGLGVDGADLFALCLGICLAGVVLAVGCLSG